MNRVACEVVRGGGLGKMLEVRAINYGGAGSVAGRADSRAKPCRKAWIGTNGSTRPRNVRSTQLDGVDALAGLRRGRNDELGCHGSTRFSGTGDGRDRAYRIDAVVGRPERKSRNEVRRRRASQLHHRAGQGTDGRSRVHGEKGKLEINRNKFTSNPPEIAQELLKKLDVAEEERKWSDSLALWQAKWHMQNWIDCIHSRNLPVADVEIGHRSVSVCHLANITRAVGRPLRWDPVEEQFVGDEAANTYLDRPRRPGFELPKI